MSDKRNLVPGQSSAQDDDPFAELVRLVEQTGSSTAYGSGREASRRGEPTLPQGWENFSFDDSPIGSTNAAQDARFTAAMQAEAARAVASSHRVTAQPGTTVASPPRPAPSSERAERRLDFDAPLDPAFLALSEPMSPRDTRPSETEAFVPERREAMHESQPRAAVLDDFDELIAGELAALRGGGSVQTSPAHAGYDEERFEAEPAYAGDPRSEDVAAYHAPAPSRRAGRVPTGPRERRVMFFAGGVAALALLGAFGAWTLTGVLDSAGVEDGPLLIKADAEPVKIQPENPGGRLIPNQNKAVYERVARSGPAQAPNQDMLISTVEEPIDLSFDDDESLPGVMVGVSDLPFPEPVQVAEADEQVVAPVLQPRRVQTFDVRPDGTLVPRAPAEESAAAPAASVPADEIRPAMPTNPAESAAAVDEAETPTPAPVDATQETGSLAAVPPAAADPVPPADAPVPQDSFFVQISSQPSQELAEQSRENLSSRFAGILGDKNLTIQSAQIPDRGTYYRVRVVAASRDEADSVCQSLQSAGGSCFVTR